MHFRQKLTFMAFGSILTLAGYLLATIASDVTAQPEKNNATFDTITCSALEVVNEQGIPVARIAQGANGGLVAVKYDSGQSAVTIDAITGRPYIQAFYPNGKRAVMIGTYPTHGYMTFSDNDGQALASIGVRVQGQGGFVEVLGKERGRATLRGTKHGGELTIVGKTDDKSRVLTAVPDYVYDKEGKEAAKLTAHEHGGRMTDRLMAARFFSICPRTEEFKVFDAVGKLVKEKKSTHGPDKDGEMSYTITSPTTAIFSGNVGQVKVEFIRADRSVTFIETTPLGGKHTMVISDEWDDKEKGFRFVYIRHINNILVNETWKTTITGIAKIKGQGFNEMKP